MSHFKVLVIEDDREISDMLAEVLQDEGYDVSVAPNGQEALTLLETIRIPNLIFLDFNMPVMNGGEFFVRLRAQTAWENIPVIVTSSERTSELRAIFKETQQIIAKPYSLDDVIAAADKVRKG